MTYGKLKSLMQGEEINKLIDHLAKTAHESFSCIGQEDVHSSLDRAVNKSIEDFQTKTWEKQLAEEINSTDGQLLLFPDGVKFLYAVENNVFVVIEEKPQIRSILWGSNRPVRYRISLPYVYFVLNFTDYQNTGNYMAFSKKPVSTFEDVVYLPCLPDTNQEFTICMGVNFYKDKTIELDGLINCCKDIIEYFWHSNFDPTHWPFNWKEQIKRDGRFEIESWHQNAMSNPLFVIEEETNYGESFSFKDFIYQATPAFQHRNNPLYPITHDLVFDNMRSMARELWPIYLNERFIPSMEIAVEVMEAELTKIVHKMADKAFSSIEETMSRYPIHVQQLVGEVLHRAFQEAIKDTVAKRKRKKKTTA